MRHFKPNSNKKESFCIALPPPNVTGTLHLGHGFNNTLQDVLIRYQRMLGKCVLWQGGTDHAGIATQMVVEKQLNQEGTSSKKLGREEFLKRVWVWKQYSGDTIVHQQKRLCISPDFDRYRFTMDEGLSEAVLEAFITLYKEGYIYKSKRLVNWDPILETAVSDLEVEKKEEMGKMYYLHYALEGSQNKGIIVATTRPETLFGDTAVAVHPQDGRFQHLIGKNVLVPLINRPIPVIGDEYCDPTKGSGAVKITPAHDFNDFEVGKRHNLPIIMILDKKAHLIAPAPHDYIGLSVTDARDKILKEVEVVDIQEHLMSKPYGAGNRSHIEIQPFLTDQWFMDMTDLARSAIDAVKNGDIQFFPKHWDAIYFQWLENIQPWCLSRQLWWGHRIPAWYGPDGTVFVAKNDKEAQHQAHIHYGKDVPLEQDADVLDTWFSSGLWPFASLGWPSETDDLKRFFPTDFLITGFDIIFFWVARMIMLSLKLTGKVPFKTVYVHGLIRDEHGQKMSKSKGNIIDPLELIDECGVDATRFAFCEMAAPSQDISFSKKKVEKARNFITKIRNAHKFLMMNVSKQTSIDRSHPLYLWIASSLGQMQQSIDDALSHYRFDNLCQIMYKFFWHDFCDVFLEGSKAYGGAGALGLEIFYEFLHLLHPVCPIVSDELYQYSYSDETLSNHKWPLYDTAPLFDIEPCLNLINNIRSVRGLFALNANQKIDIYLSDDWTPFESLYPMIESLTKSHIQSSLDEKGVSVSVGEKKAFFMLGDALKLDEAIQILDKKITCLQSDIDKLQKKITNAAYQHAKPDAWAQDNVDCQKKVAEQSILIDAKSLLMNNK
jgi:valyl-tRNA synthetase